MKDDWPIATKLYDPGPPIGWRKGFGLAVIFVLMTTFLAVFFSGPNLAVTKEPEGHYGKIHIYAPEADTVAPHFQAQPDSTEHIAGE
jgi:hypothetical protein